MHTENCLLPLSPKTWLPLTLNFGCRVIDKENSCLWRPGPRPSGRTVAHLSTGWENPKRQGPQDRSHTPTPTTLPPTPGSRAPPESSSFGGVEERRCAGEGLAHGGVSAQSCEGVAAAERPEQRLLEPASPARHPSGSSWLPGWASSPAPHATPLLPRPADLEVPQTCQLPSFQARGPAAPSAPTTGTCFWVLSLPLK